MKRKLASIAVLALFAGASVHAAEIRIRIAGSEPATQKSVQYRCDANGPKLGLPAGPFTVEYINGGGNSLAVLPVNGKPLIFANVVSGSGARYAAGRLIWWEAAGRSISLRTESSEGIETKCQRADAQ